MFDIRKEIEFWTGIMGDHGEFQYMNLSPKEGGAIQTAGFFINLFRGLHEEAKSMVGELNHMEISHMISKNLGGLTAFIGFKRILLKKLMTCDIELGLTPTFLNHMINEAMEYHRVLSIGQGRMPFNKVLENIRLHKIWLPDASGHASAIGAGLDATQAELIQQAQGFEKRFDNLSKKASEMYKMFERTGLQNGSLNYFNREVFEEIQRFIEYLKKIENLRRDCTVYGSGLMAPLLPEHMIREEEYYMYRVKSLKI